MIERLGEYSPGLEEMLAALDARIEGDKIVIPTHGIRPTVDGLEVNVRHHYCRFHEGEWKKLRVVNARRLVP